MPDTNTGQGLTLAGPSRLEELIRYAQDRSCS